MIYLLKKENDSLRLRFLDPCFVYLGTKLWTQSQIINNGSTNLRNRWNL